MRYKPLNPELFKLNRKRFIREMRPNTLAIFHSNDLMPRSGDTTFPFRQNAGLLYLSGIDQEETVLILFPDCVREKFRELLLIKRTSDHIAIWDGKKLSKEEATELSGIEKILFLDESDAILKELIHLSDGVYVNTNEHEKNFSEIPTRDVRLAKKMRDKFPIHPFHRSQPILKKLMMVKSPLEIAAIKKSIGITERAFRRACNFIEPGVWEFQVEAEITHEFLMNRCTAHSYEPIIAGGKNACVLHYISNEKQLREGDVVLMDFGAEHANYASDLTRCVPVSGQFSPRQAAVYEAVLRVMKEAISLLVPGATLEDYNEQVGKIMSSELRGLGLLTQKDIDDAPEDKPAYKKYFMHGTAHHLGLDVHDLNNRYDPFQAGMVFTCEPGIYIPEEGLGIRLEDNILITDNGPVNLFANIPIELEEIEEMMSIGLLV